MDIRRILAIYFRQLFLFRRSVARVLGVFYWSTVELLLWGFITLYLDQINRSSYNYATLLLGGFLLWDFFIRSNHGISISFLEDIWSRNVANLFGSPLRIGEYLAGLVLISATNGIITVLVTATLAFIFFHFNVLELGWQLIPFALMIFAFGWALGFATIAFILRFGPSAEIFAWSIPFLLQPFSAVFYPISALPTYFQGIAKFIPLTHIFEGMRTILHGGRVDGRSLIIAAALTALYLALGIAIFIAMFHRARRQGFLVRFTTE